MSQSKTMLFIVTQTKDANMIENNLMNNIMIKRTRLIVFFLFEIYITNSNLIIGPSSTNVVLEKKL